MPFRDQSEAGGYYHVFNRGNNHQPVFFERENFVFFLRLLHECFPTNNAAIVGYCLMPNHFHLIIHTFNDTLSNHMQSLSLRYTKSINESRQRVGSLFQGRYKSIPVNDNAYLVNLSAYIYLNPLKAGLAVKAEDWAFSSYRDYIGIRAGTLPKPAIVLSQFVSVQAYRRFVENYSPKDESIISRLLFD
jgi:REP element-mobilizing transposase RayT